MKLSHRLLIVLLLGATDACAAIVSPIPVAELFGNPRYSATALSGDGKSLAFVVSEGDVQIVAVRPVEGGKPTPLFKLDDATARISWLGWANDRRVLASVEAAHPGAVGVRARATRLYGVDIDGKQYEWLGKRWQGYRNSAAPIQAQDEIVHWTPDVADSLLVQVGSPYVGEWPRVARMDVRTGALATVVEELDQVSAWHADQQGGVRAGEAYRNRKHYELWFRASAADKWQRVIDGSGEISRLRFLGFHSGDPSRIYVTGPLDGRLALFEYDTGNRQLGPVVFSDAQVDVDGLLHSGDGSARAVGVAYTTDTRRIRYFDAEMQRDWLSLEQALGPAFGEHLQLGPLGQSRDGNRQLLVASSDQRPPVYYLYDKTSKALSPLFEQRRMGAGSRFSPVRRVTIPARDGLALPAYLTLPAGSDGKQLPMIVLVHGGPWSRDSAQWDPEVQLFASRGFAVLQVNYRGSTGFGSSHVEAGHRQWGLKMQDDIADGVGWAIRQGIADADRIGIYGASFGGYSALVGLQRTPGLYRAGAAYAAVTDVARMLADDRWYSMVNDDYRDSVGDVSDAAGLRAISPLHAAGSIDRPVLLGHGEEDDRVHVDHSRRMHQALLKAGKQVSYLEFPNEAHGFALEASRIRWYESLVKFFERELAPRAQAK